MLTGQLNVLFEYRLIENDDGMQYEDTLIEYYFDNEPRRIKGVVYCKVNNDTDVLTVVNIEFENTEPDLKEPDYQEFIKALIRVYQNSNYIISPDVYKQWDLTKTEGV